MSDQSKNATYVQPNQKQLQQQLASAPTIAESMVTITELMGTKPNYSSTTKTDKRYFTDEKGTFQEMDTTKKGDVVAE